MRRFLAILLAIPFIIFAQTVSITGVKGVGKNRNEALDDAKRNAVEQALGVIVGSETQVKNYKLIKDVISTKAQGYIKSFTVKDETPYPDRYEVVIDAIVTRSPIEADVKSLSKRMGGVRFMVYVDPTREFENEEQREIYEYTMDRINEFLSNKGYRYAEPKVVKKLLQEAKELYRDGNTNSNLTVAQEIAFAADAEFYIDVNKILINLNPMEIEQGGRKAYSAEGSVELKLYDAGTAEGVTNVIGKIGSQDTVVEWGREETMKKAVDIIVNKAMKKMVYRIAKRFGEWIETGYPYELRFYGIGGYRKLRLLKKKLTADNRFGGEIDIVSAGDYTRMNLSFKGTADELADAVLDYCDEIEGFPTVDVKLIVFNQLNFAPYDVNVPQPGIQPPQSIGGER